MPAIVQLPVMRYTLLCGASFLLLVLLAGFTQAQIGGIDSDPGGFGTGGANVIEGRIYYSNNRQLDKRVRVRLSSVTVGDYTVYTDDNGAFTFRRLAAGRYTLTVEAGREFNAAYETVEFRVRGGQVARVEIRLQPRETGNNSGQPGVLDAALANVPKPAVDLYQKAIASAQSGDSKKAVEQLKSAVQIYPQFTLALNVLGVQYMRLNLLGEAAAAFRDALAVTPDAYLPRFNLGMTLLQQKKYAEAETEFSRAIQKNDSSVVAHLYRGRVLIHLRRFGEAEKELRRVISLGGDEAAMAHRYLGALYKEQSKNKRAVEELERYLKLVPNAKDAAQIREIIIELQKQASATGK